MLTPKQRGSFSIALAMLAFAPEASDTSFPHLEAFARISSIFSSLDKIATSSVKVFS